VTLVQGRLVLALRCTFSRNVAYDGPVRLNFGLTILTHLATALDEPESTDDVPVKPRLPLGAFAASGGVVWKGALPGSGRVRPGIWCVAGQFALGAAGTIRHLPGTCPRGSSSAPSPFFRSRMASSTTAWARWSASSSLAVPARSVMKTSPRLIPANGIAQIDGRIITPSTGTASSPDPHLGNLTHRHRLGHPTRLSSTGFPALVGDHARRHRH